MNVFKDQINDQHLRLRLYIYIYFVQFLYHPGEIICAMFYKKHLQSLDVTFSNFTQKHTFTQTHILEEILRDKMTAVQT
jgi:hypothetical protein